MTGSRRWWVGLLYGVVSGAAATVAAADWLVTREGAKVETRGAWEVKGRQVVFTLPNGTLSSVRLDEVDLEASASATAEARQPPPEPEPVASEDPPPPVMVLTNQDIRSRAVPPPSAAAGEESADGETAAGAGGAADGRTEASGEGRDVEIQLLTWKAQPSDTVGGLEIVGTLRNVGTDPAAKVEVGVKILGENGETEFETTAFVRSSGLAPGRHTNFRALLPNIYQLAADPVFDVRAVFVVTGGEPPPDGNS